MKVMILGGTAFIGAAAARRLCALGHEVTVFHRGRTNAPLPDAVLHLHGDRNQLDEFRPEFKRCKPDVLLDMLCMTERDAQDVLRVFTGLAPRAVVISSIDVYRAFGLLNGFDGGAPAPLPLREDSALRETLYPYRGSRPRPADSPQRWMDHYDKILVERVFTSQQKLPATILRLPMVYGPGDRQHRLFPYLKRMLDQRPRILLDERVARWRACRGYVEDIAEAIACCVLQERAKGRVYHVAEPDAVSEQAWVERIGRAAGWQGRVMALPESKLPVNLQASFNPDQELLVDSSRIRNELGHRELIEPAQAMARTVVWERDNPPERWDPESFDYAEEDAV